MSTITSAQLADESDGEDHEYIPSPKAKGKRKAAATDGDGEDSATSDSGDEDGDEPNKRVKMDAELQELKEERRRVAMEQLKGFEQDELVKNGAPEVIPEALVKVQRARRFAGETILETVELKASDPEAVAFLAKQGQETRAVPEPPIAPAVSSADSSSAAPDETVSKPKPKSGPARRKPRASLEAMSASMGKGKKMTTLEKSQMDWKKHTETDGLQDELSLNRKGGYLEKQAFLERVQERRGG